MVALGKQCGQHDSVGGISGGLEIEVANYRRNMCAFSHLPTHGNHATPGQLRDIVELLWGDQLWDQYFKFTIVRNPWDRAVSWLDYSLHELGQKLAFEHGLENTERPYWFSPAGEPLADFYLRYESLETDYETLCQRLGMAHEALPKLRVGQRDRSKPYWEYYSEDTRDIVARKFDREIDYFSYEFGQ